MQTDNKTIMINGVDVKDCEFLESDKIRCSINKMFCSDWNCHYKQLKSKEQECVKLQVELNNLKQDIENFCGCKIRDDKTGLPICENADKYKQAFEKIAEVIKNLEKENICTFPDLDLKTNTNLIIKQCNRGYVEILEIINKVKGLKNGIDNNSK